MKTVGQRLREHWLADLKADWLARWVSIASDQRLQAVMRSWPRRILLWQIFRTMRRRAQPDPRMAAVVEFRISGRRDGGVDRYHVTFTDGRCRSSPGARSPDLTLELEPVAFLHLVTGIGSPQRLLLTGKLKLRGDLMLALALPRVLRLPRRRPRSPSRPR
jgi:putative sterol carrier protein